MLKLSNLTNWLSVLFKPKKVVDYDDWYESIRPKEGHNYYMYMFKDGMMTDIVDLLRQRTGKVIVPYYDQDPDSNNLYIKVCLRPSEVARFVREVKHFSGKVYCG